MYPILEYSSTYLILEYYAYFHTNTLLTVSVYTILMHADNFKTFLIVC